LEKSDPLLTVQDIHTYYGESYVLQGISLKVRQGQILALLGRNGMGKTTLIRSISGLTPPRRGMILFKEHPISGLPSYEIGQLGMSLVPQGRRIFPSLTVRENLLVPTSSLTGRKAKGNSSAKNWALETVLQEFPRLAERALQFAGSLSGGEQQMLAIGRALMANPDLILMDEPSEGLSPMLVLQIEKIMKSLREQGRAVLLVEQNFGLALSAADEIHILTSGKIVYHGTPKELIGEREILDRQLGVSVDSAVYELPEK
jgi:branched-chain amino acid transport system ATP-binding protein